MDCLKPKLDSGYFGNFTTGIRTSMFVCDIIKMKPRGCSQKEYIHKISKKQQNDTKYQINDKKTEL